VSGALARARRTASLGGGSLPLSDTHASVNHANHWVHQGSAGENPAPPFQSPVKVTFCIVALQMLIAFAGATSFLRCRVDKAEVLRRIRRTLVTRYWLRSASLLLPTTAFLYLGISVLF